MSLSKFSKLLHNTRRISSFFLGLSMVLILLILVTSYVSPRLKKIVTLLTKDRPEGALDYNLAAITPFLVAALILCIIMYIIFRAVINVSLFLKVIKFDYSKISSQELRGQISRSAFPEALLKKIIPSNVTKNEFETFNVLLTSFEGNVEDLILVSKELS